MYDTKVKIQYDCYEDIKNKIINIEKYANKSKRLESCRKIFCSIIFFL